jgi:hypothetical protein
LRSRSRPDGTIEGAVSDLVAMNPLNPLLVEADVIGIASRSRAERSLVAAGHANAVRDGRLEIRGEVSGLVPLLAWILEAQRA